MSSPHQPGFFLPDAEPDLFGPDYAPRVYYPDPDRVRGRLQKILAELRGAAPHRLDGDRELLPAHVFADAEMPAAQLRFEFETELARLKAA